MSQINRDKLAIQVAAEKATKNMLSTGRQGLEAAGHTAWWSSI